MCFYFDNHFRCVKNKVPFNSRKDCCNVYFKACKNKKHFPKGAS